eukprot:81527-Chlamydomonas_euryale.AAC.2
MPARPAQARVEIAKYLDGKGLLRGHADNPMRLGLCSRSKDVIEPVLKPQWVSVAHLVCKVWDVWEVWLFEPLQGRDRA